jgi:hypothetical protein
MAPAASNLFQRLHKWAARQDENFLTESLAVVLEQLLALAPEVGTRLVARLTGGFVGQPPEDASRIEVATQIEGRTGRPDLAIRSPHRLAWIEVKVESELRAGQLEGYRVLLAESGVEQTRLILLTRYPQSARTDTARADLELRWFEVADWFEAELPTAVAADDVAGFLVRQFLDFLEARGMTITQVGKYMPEGLRALSNLTNMLGEAAAACGTKVVRKSWTDEAIGLTLTGGFWVGVEFDEPDTLWFSTVDNPFNPEAVGEHPGWEQYPKSWRAGECYACRKLALDSEEVHFFSRSKVSQMECLEGFLRECLQQAKSFGTTGSPAG